jgi:hypothetical protein
MQNLSYQKTQILLNTVGQANLATFKDKDGVKKLIIKDKGIVLSGGPGASVGKSVSDAFMGKAVLLKQTKNDPASPVNVEFGFRIESKLRTPGYIDNSEYWPTGKFYGSIAPNLSTFADAQVLEMDNIIMRMINGDKGFSQDAAVPTGSIVSARRAYTVVDADNTDASGFTITWPDGTTTAFVTKTTFGDGEFGTQLMASSTAAYGSTVGALLEAYQIAADTYIITSREEGLEFSLGTGVDATISVPGILLTSRHDDILFNVQFNPYEWTSQGLNLTKINGGGFGSAFNGHVSVDGTVTEVTATTQANILTALNAITGVNALADGTAAMTIASTLAVDFMAVNFPVINAAGNAPLTKTPASITFEACKSGKFSVMNADDVAREFAALDHAGFLRSAIRGNFNTTAGISYTKFIVTGTTKVGAIHGASHTSQSEVAVEIYIPTEACRGDLWDDTDKDTGKDVPSGALDRTIEEVLAYWAS